MFRSVYESTLYHPLLFWLAGGALVLAIARRLPFLYAYLVVFVVEILADATLTSAWSPLRTGTVGATAASVAFVILGDARYFVLLARAQSAAMSPVRWLAAFGLALVVPIAAYLPKLASPDSFAEPRVTFLVYEAIFAAFACALRVWLKTRVRDPSMRRWALRATNFEIGQYALWALADVAILAGHDAGFALRLVPNTMYYALYLPFVAWAAPRELTEPWREARA
jgi:hypothetical protein